MEEKYFIQATRVGEKVENFTTEAVMPNKEFKTVSLEENMKAGKWTILFFWPLDFTFVCPTEIVALSDAVEKFERENTQIFGISTDSVHSHLAWTKLAPKDGGIGDVKFPLLEDTNHSISEQFGVLIEDKGIALRGLFIISPEGVLEHATINSLNVGRSVDETLRTLSALQSGGLCPMNWSAGDETL
ncbi:MAG: peroxiredoxin [Mycoplasmatales bacterium]